MNTVSPIKDKSGLRVDLGGTPPLRKLKADHGGIYFWDKKNIILDDLGDFLAKVEQGKQSVIFSKLDGNAEVCKDSTPLGKRKIRRATHDSLSKALITFKSRLNQNNLDVDAQRLIQAFRLPNPNKLPEFYRVYKGNDGHEQLVILWGCDRVDSDSVGLDDIPNLLQKQSWLSEFWDLHFKKILAVLCLLLMVLLVLLYLSWPRPVISVSKLELAPRETMMLGFTGSQGRSFEVAGHDAALVGSDKTWKPSSEGILIQQLENGMFPASRPNLPQVQCSFSSPGEKKVTLTATTRFMGMTLPAASRDIFVNVRDIGKMPGDDVVVVVPLSQFTAKQTTAPGVFPARVLISSPNGGPIDFGNGEHGKLEKGAPLNYGGYHKPGLYKLTNSGPDGVEPKSIYLPLDPPEDQKGLVANIRPSKNHVSQGERFVADCSSSFHQDPVRKIVSKRLSINGGKSFEPMKGSYAVVQAGPPGDMKLVLEVADDAGVVKRDTANVKVDDEVAPSITLPDVNSIGKTIPNDVKGVEIPDALLFQSGSADVSAKGKERLTDFAKKIAESGRKIQVVGHTDDTMISPELRKRYRDNDVLSLERAKSAAKILEAGGVPSERINIQGMGAKQPKSEEKSDKARAANRRIEIFFFE